MFVIDISTLLLFVSKFDKRAILEVVTALILEILMSTLADLVSKFKTLGEKDDVTALILEIEMSTLADLLSILLSLFVLTTILLSTDEEY